MSHVSNSPLYRIAAIATMLIALALLIYSLVAQDWIVAGFAAMLIACSATSYPLTSQRRKKVIARDES